MRCLKDSGCQYNFILKDIAIKNRLKVIENELSITINGFNSVKNYKTFSVEVPLAIGSKTRVLSAICLPKININMNLQGLTHVVAQFRKKGYTLADTDLMNSDKITDISLIFGANSFHCIEEKAVIFPETTNPSIYYDTPMGVILMGSLGEYRTNIKHLKQNNYSSTLCPQEVDQYSVTDRGLLGSHLLVSHERNEHLLDLNSDPLSRSGIQIDSFGAIINDNIEKELELPGEIISEQEAEALYQKCNKLLNYEEYSATSLTSDENLSMINKVLSTIERDEEGRLIVPILWNEKTSHALGDNFNLAKTILNSNYQKLLKSPKNLEMVDSVFHEQSDMNIIEKISDLPKFLKENKNSCSFMPHMPVFRPDKQSTKCRVVYLANLAQKSNDKFTICHNQAIVPGVNLNKKLSTAITQLRFDTYLVLFDLVKAFLMVKLFDEDSKRLCTLWFNNLTEGDKTLVGYIHRRLPFGLPCSPSLLMISLLYILIHSSSVSERSSDLKKKIYNLSYMDNCGYSCNTVEELEYALPEFNKIFNPFKFNLQQYASNWPQINRFVPSELLEDRSDTKIFGLLWNTIDDSLYPPKFKLNVNSLTKRQILSDIASNYDLLQMYGPILNRARIFMHELQLRTDLGWDTELSPELLKQWSKIAKQVNHCPNLSIPRSFGGRTDPYNLVAFTDSSNIMYGCVLYLHNLLTNKLTFVLARNRIVNKGALRTIPTLEMEDSLVCLSWLQSYATKIEKINKRSVLVQNRLSTISKKCELFPIHFKFCAGIDNPADLVTRQCSHKQLARSCYHTGPPVSILSNDDSAEVSTVVIPNPLLENSIQIKSAIIDVRPEPLIDMNRHSKYTKAINICCKIIKFCNILKSKVNSRLQTNNFKILSDEQILEKSTSKLIFDDQRLYFGEIHSFMDAPTALLKDIPELVTKLNLFRDEHGLLRVKCKLRTWSVNNASYPILMSKDSSLTKLIILNTHARLSHVGCYSLLSEIRKIFWVPNIYSVTKKIVKSCVHCKRMNGKLIKLNQNAYRKFRVDPPNIPFRNIFLDYAGPFYIKSNGQKTKTYILCITCLWSRAINLIVCSDLTVIKFLRGFQLHCFQYGIPQLCYSDAGSQIVAGTNIIMDFLKDEDTKSYLLSKNIKALDFKQFSRGCKKLGGLIESGVKITKRLLYGSIRKLILDRDDFEFLICQINHLANRRPIAFKQALRDNNANHEIPSPITPEILLKGFELPSINIIPQLHGETPDDPPYDPNSDPVNLIKFNYSKLNKARKNLSDVYHGEFLATLVEQSTNVKDRFQPVNHIKLKPGDLVILSEPFTKRSHFPMGLVIEVTENDLSEVTDAILIKSDTKERVSRHVSSLIPILTTNDSNHVNRSLPSKSENDKSRVKCRPSRKSAKQCSANNKNLAAKKLI